MSTALELKDINASVLQLLRSNYKISSIDRREFKKFKTFPKYELQTAILNVCENLDYVKARSKNLYDQKYKAADINTFMSNLNEINKEKKKEIKIALRDVYTTCQQIKSIEFASFSLHTHFTDSTKENVIKIISFLGNACNLKNFLKVRHNDNGSNLKYYFLIIAKAKTDIDNIKLNKEEKNKKKKKTAFWDSNNFYKTINTFIEDIILVDNYRQTIRNWVRRLQYNVNTKLIKKEIKNKFEHLKKNTQNDIKDLFKIKNENGFMEFTTLDQILINIQESKHGFFENKNYIFYKKFALYFKQKYISQRLITLDETDKIQHVGDCYIYSDPDLKLIYQKWLSNSTITYNEFIKRLLLTSQDYAYILAKFKNDCINFYKIAYNKLRLFKLKINNKKNKLAALKLQRNEEAVESSKDRSTRINVYVGVEIADDDKLYYEFYLNSKDENDKNLGGDILILDKIKRNQEYRFYRYNDEYYNQYPFFITDNDRNIDPSQDIKFVSDRATRKSGIVGNEYISLKIPYFVNNINYLNYFCTNEEDDNLVDNAKNQINIYPQNGFIEIEKKIKTRTSTRGLTQNEKYNTKLIKQYKQKEWLNKGIDTGDWIYTNNEEDYKRALEERKRIRMEAQGNYVYKPDISGYSRNEGDGLFKNNKDWKWNREVYNDYHLENEEEWESRKRVNTTTETMNDEDDNSYDIKLKSEIKSYEFLYKFWVKEILNLKYSIYVLHKYSKVIKYQLLLNSRFDIITNLCTQFNFLTNVATKLSVEVYFQKLYNNGKVEITISGKKKKVQFNYDKFSVTLDQITTSTLEHFKEFVHNLVGEEYESLIYGDFEDSISKQRLSHEEIEHEKQIDSKFEYNKSSEAKGTDIYVFIEQLSASSSGDIVYDFKLSWDLQGDNIIEHLEKNRLYTLNWQSINYSEIEIFLSDKDPLFYDPKQDIGLKYRIKFYNEEHFFRNGTVSRGMTKYGPNLQFKILDSLERSGEILNTQTIFLYNTIKKRNQYSMVHPVLVYYDGIYHDLYGEDYDESDNDDDDDEAKKKEFTDTSLQLVDEDDDDDDFILPSSKKQKKY